MGGSIEFGKVGRIVANPRSLSIGWFIEIRPEAGGFLILYFEDANRAIGDEYDDFAVSEEELEARLRGWEIEWLG